MSKTTILLHFAILFPLITLSQKPSYDEIVTVDPQASKQTKALYANFRKLAKTRIMFGHQDALAYGVQWKDWHKKRSDVKDVCGKYPAVFGWDMSKLGKYSHNIDTVDFENMKAWIKQAYRMGGINTISWHFDNFTTGGDSWETGERVVADILPGGQHHNVYKQKLDLFAAFVRDLRVGWLVKKDIPIIFRPFHEHTGSWFWWGKNHCTVAEYKALWRFTVTYLRDEKKIHQLLYCYSPDIFKDKEEYLERYPGDEYVDILGLDDYHDVGAKGNTRDFVERLQMLVEIAEEKAKPAALTETGFEAIPDKNWWTETLLNPIKNDPVASRIAWVMVWRNARSTHHYGPYPGHISAEDFKKFSQDKFVLFANQLPQLYKLK